jgi:site-specific DNA-methyltransferase (adenine-specific)
MSKRPTNPSSRLVEVARTEKVWQAAESIALGAGGASRPSVPAGFDPSGSSLSFAGIPIIERASGADDFVRINESFGRDGDTEVSELSDTRNAREAAPEASRTSEVTEATEMQTPEVSGSTRVHVRASDPAEPAAEWVPRSTLKPWPKNPRHNEDAIDQVVASINRFGFGNPILARRSDNEVIAGHTRLLAAEKIGMDLVPVRFMDLDEADAHLFALADNKLAETATWDDLGVAALLAGYADTDADLAGFDAEERERLQRIVDRINPIDGDDDENIELPAEPVSEPGAVYELGPHRLVCGDSTNSDVWVSLLGDERVDLVWTDPPYGVAYVGKTKDALRIENDALDEAGLEKLLRDSLGMAIAHVRPGSAFYVASPAGPLFHVFGTVLRELGVWRHTLTWVKQQFVMGRCDYHYRHEPIFYGWEPNGPHFWCGARNLDTVLEFDRPKRSTEHPTMKPPELIQHCIRNSSELGATVLDPFGGSGSTMIAAAKEGRRARLIELDPKYCDVIRKRWGHFARSAGADAGSGAL